MARVRREDRPEPGPSFPLWRGLEEGLGLLPAQVSLCLRVRVTAGHTAGSAGVGAQSTAWYLSGSSPALGSPSPALGAQCFTSCSEGRGEETGSCGALPRSGAIVSPPWFPGSCPWDCRENAGVIRQIWEVQSFPSREKSPLSCKFWICGKHVNLFFHIICKIYFNYTSNFLCL